MDTHFLCSIHRYILSTGGASGTFTCGSDSGFDAFLSSYASAYLAGVDFDIEGSQSVDQVRRAWSSLWDDRITIRNSI